MKLNNKYITEIESKINYRFCDEAKYVYIGSKFSANIIKHVIGFKAFTSDKSDFYKRLINSNYYGFNIKVVVKR